MRNGDAENGSCAIDRQVKHPIQWNWNGRISQITYDVSTLGDLFSSSAGPK